VAQCNGFGLTNHTDIVSRMHVVLLYECGSGPRHYWITWCDETRRCTAHAGWSIL